MYQKKIGETKLQNRTSILKGDRLVFEDTKGGYLLGIVRENHQSLYFEEIGNICERPDNKLLINQFLNTEIKSKFEVVVKIFLLLICQITGLQAKLVEERDSYVIYDMQEGEKVFS